MTVWEPSRVGFIGLGNIGKPMAQRLLAWEGGLTVFDLALEPLRELEAAGARVAPTVAALAAECGVISIMVNTDAQVRDVVEQIVDAAGPGTVLLVHSTVAPSAPKELEDLGRRHDLMVLDAPVSGGAIGASDGTLAIMVGGTDAAFETARAPLALMGSEVAHCGPIGSGTAAKLARNLLHFVSFTATGEALRLAEAAGIDLIALGRIVRHTDSITGGPGAIMHRDTARQLEPGDFWITVFEHVNALGTKDLDHAVELATTLGVDTPLAKYARQNLAAALGLESVLAAPNSVASAHPAHA